MTDRPWLQSEIEYLLAARRDGRQYGHIGEVLGRSKSACQAQYARVTQVTKPRPAVTKRPCMCCRQPFKSEGPHNRLCNHCGRKSNDSYSMGHRRGTVYA